jgi:hypothetical protein
MPKTRVGRSGPRGDSSAQGGQIKTTTAVADGAPPPVGLGLLRMPLYVLEPVPARLADPAWAACAHRAHCLVAARGEREARERAAQALARRSNPPPIGLSDDSPPLRPAPPTPSPWLQERLVSAREMVLMSDDGLAEAATRSVLVPQLSAPPRARGGYCALDEAEPAPRIGSGAGRRDEAKAQDRSSPSAPAKRAVPKVAHPGRKRAAPPKRAAAPSGSRTRKASAPAASARTRKNAAPTKRGAKAAPQTRHGPARKPRAAKPLRKAAAAASRRALPRAKPKAATAKRTTRRASAPRRR